MARDALVGTTLAGYAIQDRIGEGGTSTVYRADHPSHGVVALKVLREKLRQDRTAVSRFTREAAFGTRVQHPNVVRTLETGNAGDGLHYLAIEWANGEILERYAKQHAPLAPDKAAHIISQIAGAVHAAHAAGIVHRDLKPANVLLTADGTPKLTDFGLAKRVAGGSGLTQTGAVLGTPSYMAPEQAGGEGKRFGPAANVYALGGWLYECLTGRPPFKAPTRSTRCSRWSNTPPPRHNCSTRRWTPTWPPSA